MAAGHAERGSDATRGGTQGRDGCGSVHQQATAALQLVAEPAASRFFAAGRMDRVAGGKRGRVDFWYVSGADYGLSRSDPLVLLCKAWSNVTNCKPESCAKAET